MQEQLLLLRVIIGELIISTFLYLWVASEFFKRAKKSLDRVAISGNQSKQMLQMLDDKIRLLAEKP